MILSFRASKTITVKSCKTGRTRSFLQTVQAMEPSFHQSEFSMGLNHKHLIPHGGVRRHLGLSNVCGNPNYADILHGIWGV